MENRIAVSSSLESIAQAIVGYDGYEQSLSRTGSDQRIRQHLQQKIRGLLKALEATPAATEAEDQARLSELIKSTKRKLATIFQSLSSPTYIGGGFFISENLAARRLERVYEFEQIMLREVENLGLELAAMCSHPLAKAVFEDHFLHIQDFIDTFNQSLFEREALLLDEEYMV